MPQITTVKVNSELMCLALYLTIHFLRESNLALIRPVKADKDRQTRLPVWAAIRGRHPCCSPSHVGP